MRVSEIRVKRIRVNQGVGVDIWKNITRLHRNTRFCFRMDLTPLWPEQGI